MSHDRTTAQTAARLCLDVCDYLPDELKQLLLRVALSAVRDTDVVACSVSSDHKALLYHHLRSVLDSSLLTRLNRVLATEPFLSTHKFILMVGRVVEAPYRLQQNHVRYVGDEHPRHSITVWFVPLDSNIPDMVETPARTLGAHEYLAETSSHVTVLDPSTLLLA